MTLLQAHLVCLGLVAADLLARAWRIQWIIRGLGHPISLWDSFVLNAFGDAACALTPLRIGGEPARLAGMLRSRVPAPAAFVAISLEVLAAWPVIIVAAGWLAWRYAPEWWQEAGPRLSAAAAAAWPWVVAVAILSWLAWRSARQRVSSPAVRQLRRPVRRAMVYWRRMPRWPLVASVPMSLVNLATRVAILPVLALALPSPPPMGPLALGSFALLYSPPRPEPEPSSSDSSAEQPATSAQTRAGSCWPGGSIPTASACCLEWCSRPGCMGGPPCGS
jgi:uncharacterized membrane protein YbhN (UPF0104 family)